jgi:hypothetical protein
MLRSFILLSLVSYVVLIYWPLLHFEANFNLGLELMKVLVSHLKATLRAIPKTNPQLK